MKLTLKRIALKETYTIGRLSIDGVFFCDTLEDKVRNLGPDGKGKVYGETAIPAGTYKVTVTHSPKFGRLLPRLHNVPFFDGILIHAGNTADSSLGCILVGKNDVVGRVTNSRYWEAELLKKLAGQSDITIEII